MAIASQDRDREVCLERAARLGAIVDMLPQRTKTTTGTLAGLTVALKDMVDLAGRAPGLGLNASASAVPERNAQVVDTLLGAGADIAAVTEMTPLAFEPSGGNPWRGRPRNPWNEDFICGGSSSGSAVAVALGAVRIALGSDTAGSLRIPAHCCGVTAWKPTNGAIPPAGTMPLAPTLDTLGFLARAAEDLMPVVELFTSGGGAIETVAIARDLVEQSARTTQLATDELRAVLTAVGVHVHTTALGDLVAACDSDVLTLLQGEAARATAAIANSRIMDETLARRLAKGHDVSNETLSAARMRLRDLALTAATEFFGTADAVVLPVMSIPTPRVVACEPGSAAFSARTLYQLSAYTRFVNGLGWPAVAIPIGLDDNGLPIGCQIVGPPGSDLALVRFAARIQNRTVWHTRDPDAQNNHDAQNKQSTTS